MLSIPVHGKSNRYVGSLRRDPPLQFAWYDVIRHAPDYEAIDLKYCFCASCGVLELTHRGRKSPSRSALGRFDFQLERDRLHPRNLLTARLL